MFSLNANEKVGNSTVGEILGQFGLNTKSSPSEIVDKILGSHKQQFLDYTNNQINTNIKELNSLRRLRRNVDKSIDSYQKNNKMTWKDKVKKTGLELTRGMIDQSIKEHEEESKKLQDLKKVLTSSSN